MAARGPLGGRMAHLRQTAANRDGHG